jgi:hypothetical protein
VATDSLLLVEAVMGFPDRIERTMEVAHAPGKVWAAGWASELGELNDYLDAA